MRVSMLRKYTGSTHRCVYKHLKLWTSNEVQLGLILDFLKVVCTVAVLRFIWHIPNDNYFIEPITKQDHTGQQEHLTAMAAFSQ